MIVPSSSPFKAKSISYRATPLPIIGADDYVALPYLATDLGHEVVRDLRLAAGTDVIPVDQLTDLLGLLRGGQL
jgi:hypothetical protein